MNREAELTAKIKAGAEGNLANELSAVYAKLTEIEADKAPARAALILFGLGFSTEMQNMKTKEFGWMEDAVGVGPCVVHETRFVIAGRTYQHVGR